MTPPRIAAADFRDGHAVTRLRAAFQRPLVCALIIWSAVTMGVVWGAAAYLDDLRAEREAETYRQADAEAAMAEQAVLRSVEAARAVHGLLGVWQRLRDLGDGAAMELLESHLRDIVQDGKLGVSQIAMVGRDGRVAWSTDPGVVGWDIGDREHVRAHLQSGGHLELFVSAPVRGRLAGAWGIHVTQPQQRADGTMAGVALVSLDPFTLSQGLGDDGSAPGHRIVVRHLSGGALLARSRDTEQHLSRPPAPDYPAVVAARFAPSGRLRYTSRFDGEDILVSYRVPPGVPVTVQAVHDYKLAMAGHKRLSAAVWIGTAAAILGALAAALAWTRGRTLATARERDREQAELLSAITSSMAQGLAAWGPDGRLLACNERYRTMLDLPEGLAVPGRHYVEVARLIAARGEYGPGDPEVLARQWYEGAMNDDQRRFTRVRPDGTVLDIAGKLLPGGGFVVTFTDVTEAHAAGRALRDSADRLQEAYERMEVMASTDALTGLANRRRFEEALTGEWARCAREQQPLSLLLMDVDHFKRFNDLYGHPAGDTCLRDIAGCLDEVARRPGDLPARLGGEEFALLMPVTDEEGALHIAERLRQGVVSRAIPHEGSTGSGSVTVSIGVATVRPGHGMDGHEQSAFMSAADAALYAAKRGGRNRVRATAEPEHNLSMVQS